MSHNDFPMVTIALPVYNEERFIGEAIDSILSQDYPNLEVLISDNNSTDKTGDICRSFADIDNRISYFRHKKNIGAVANHLFLLKSAKGKYFMWAAGHDKHSANIISECIFLLENSPRANIAFGTPVWIDQSGNRLKKYSGWCETRGLNPVARFFMVFWGSMNPILGVIRRSEIPALSDLNFVGSDLVILSSLALKGEFGHASNAYFFRRSLRPAENHYARMARYKSKDVQIANSFLDRLFPLAKLPIELVKIVIKSQIDIGEKFCILMILIPSLPIRYIMGKKDSR